jgi:uncharacterized protein YjbI with pentapeptide repeats
MASKQPQMERCSQDDCLGIRLPTTTWCLAHAAEQAPDAFDAELERIRTEGTVDARGVVISAELLQQLLAAAPRTDDRPTFTAARFDRATFQGEAGFGGASFQGTASFDRATFQGEAWFVRASFQGAAEFDRASFQDTARFTAASLQGTASFDRATFQGEAWFDGVSFQGEAWFVRASFQGEARFGGATFRDAVGFGRASFQGAVGFGRASFQGAVGFGRASFQGEARFFRANFKHATQVGPLLARQLVLDGAVFGARVQLDVTAAAVCARRTQFPAGAHLRLRYATVVLDDANLAAPAILAGAPSPFPQLEEHEQQVTRGWARLPPGPREQRWRPRLLSVRRADVAGLRLADTDLRACRFVGAHNLDRLRIEGAPLFARTTGWWRARRKTLAEEQHWRANRPGRWEPVGWYPRACQPPASPKAEMPEVLNPARVAALYRELRKGREDAKDEPGAADFYYGEMEMRRLDRQTTPWPERVILWLYWLTSGYGLRGMRALASLVLVIVGLAGLLQAIGFNGGAPGFRDVLIYAAQTTISMPSSNRALTEDVSWAGEVLRIVLRLAGPVLLGLLLLSIRGRVRR